MVGILLQAAMGTPLNWLGRGAQMLGGVYLFMAALVILRESREKGIPAGDAMAGLFMRMDARLKESEKKYRNLFENMTEAFSLFEVIRDENGQPKDLRILEVNKAWEARGIPREKAVGRRLSEVTPTSAPTGRPRSMKWL
jgi:PAS domain-containing protein